MQVLLSPLIGAIFYVGIYLSFFLLLHRSWCGLVLTIPYLSMAVKLDASPRRPAFHGGIWGVIIKCETGFHLIDILCPWRLPLLDGFFILQCVWERMCTRILCGSSFLSVFLPDFKMFAISSSTYPAKLATSLFLLCPLPSHPLHGNFGWETFCFH